MNGRPVDAADRAAAIAAWWVRCYTAGVDAEAAEGRRAEITSDVWEQRAHGRSVDAPPIAVAVSIVRRVAGGVPADLIWSHTQRTASRGRPSQEEVPIMSTMTKLARHWWWTAAAAAIAVFYLWVVVSNLNDPLGPYAEASALAVLCAAMVVAGLVVRPRNRPVGDVLLAVGAGPAVVVVWFWPIAVAAVAVLVFAIVDLADARALNRPGHRRSLVTVSLVGAVLGTVLAWTAMISLGGWPTIVVAAAALVMLIVLVVALTRSGTAADVSGAAA